MKPLIFVLVFDEVARLPALLDEIRAADLPGDLLLVDNGSSDGSELLVRDSGLPSLVIDENLGVGHGLICAIDWALERDYDAICGIAGNGKMLPSELHRVLDPILADEADYVTGSRFLEGGASPNLPGFRRRSIPLVNRFVRLFTGARVTDATCGYRAFRLELMRRARFDWHARWMHTYSFEYYLYAKVILDGGIRWREVPITMRYPPKGQPYSKIPPIVGWFQMLRPWVWARLHRKGFDPA